MSWHGNVFCSTVPLWGESTVTDAPQPPLQQARNMELWCFLNNCLNKLLNKQWSCNWSEMPWCSSEVTLMFNTIRPEQDSSHFVNKMFKGLFLNMTLVMLSKVSAYNRGHYIMYNVFFNRQIPYIAWSKTKAKTRCDLLNKLYPSEMHTLTASPRRLCHCLSIRLQYLHCIIKGDTAGISTY